MLCGRTLQAIISHLACSLNDNEGSELTRIAAKNGTYDPDGNGIPDGIDFQANPTPDENALNHITWSEVFLTNVLNDAFRILHMERPDLFNCRIRFLLKPGCPIQPLGDKCCKFGGDLRNDDCNGGDKPIEISESQLRSSQKLGKLFCSGSGTDEDYVVKGTNFNPKRPKEFFIQPTPPHGKDTYVTFMCVTKPPCFEWDVDKDKEIAECLLDDYEPWFVEYALFRAHMTDRESETSLLVADRHWNNGFKLIADGKTSDYMFYHPDLYLIGPIEEGTGERIVLQSE